MLEAMPSTNLKPEGEDDVLETDRVYRTTYMFSATMPPQASRSPAPKTYCTWLSRSLQLCGSLLAAA